MQSWRARSAGRVLALLSLVVIGLLAISGSAIGRPDGRGYELVSPPDKNGGDIVADSQRTRAAADGSALGFISLTSFGDPLGSGVASDYISVRSSSPAPGSNGWTTHGVSPLQAGLPLISLLGANEPHYVGEFSDDLTSGAALAWSPLTNDPNVSAVENLYRRDNLLQPGPGHYQLLSGCPLCAALNRPLVGLPGGPLAVIAATNMRPVLAGASPDFSHVIFESRQNLTADAPPQPGSCILAVGGGGCRGRLYEWEEGTLRLAGILPDGTPAPVSIAGQGAGGSHRVLTTPHTISDGSDVHSRIFFTSPTNGSGTTSNGAVSGNLFVRVDGAATDQMNASERGVADAFAPARFLDASKNGERAFFMTSQALTDEAPADGAAKIYMYDAAKPGSATDNLTYLGTDMIGMIGSSSDGHFAYLVSNSRISLWHDGTTVDVAPAPSANLSGNLISGAAWDLNIRQARVAPDGRHVVWRTSEGSDLVGYDHGDCNGVPCQELYIYSADSDQVACVSCNPTGAPATANATTAVRTNGGGTQQSWHENHALSDNGSRVFFSTAEALVPEDVNGRIDAYEYNVLTGTVALLSSGKGQSNSWFLDASRDGNDAFFLTRDQLVGWDNDRAYDIYDARVGGGFPGPPRPAELCVGEACRGLPRAGLGALPAPPTATFDGAGNLTSGRSSARRCKRDKARRRVRGRVRCVRVRRGRRHSHVAPRGRARGGRGRS